MKTQHIALTLAAAAALIAAVIFSQRPAPESKATSDKAAVEAIIHDYLMENPDVLVAALNAFRAKEEAARQEQVSDSIASFVSSIEDNPALPFIGNADASVTIVEFFDYRCGYCKRVVPALQELMASDGDIRLVFAEFPILGEASIFASRAALAVWFNWPEQYVAFHDALMASRGTLDETVVMGTAIQLGLDRAVLKESMAKPNVEAAIQANYALAEQLGINGTPAFIIGDTLVPGAIELTTFRDHIETYRGS